MQEEKHSDEDDNEPETDEHIWTSPKNAIKMVNAISDAICQADSQNDKYYKENTKDYVSKLEELDKSFSEIVKNGKRNEIIFGDRFPLIYFTKEYGLKYYAAFPGCASETLGVILIVLNSQIAAGCALLAEGFLRQYIVQCTVRLSPCKQVSDEISHS